jgi:hypothetical protein
MSVVYGIIDTSRKEKLMAIFIANENGDWWEYQPNSVMYVLDTDDLPDEVADEWRDEDGEITWTDEQTVWEYGKKVSQDKLLS